MSDLPHITQNFARPSYRPDAPAGMDPEMKRMAILAAGFGGAVALVIGAFSLSHHVHHGIPVIAPPPGPVRVAPADPGGMKLAGDGEDAGAPGTEKLAPAAEQPELRALRAKEHKAPVMAEAAPPPPRVQTAPPVQQAAALAAAPPDAPGGTMVQLAAFESQAAAEQDWGRMAEKMPELFTRHKPEVDRVSLAGRTVFRLRTGGFPSIAAATEFCAAIREKGGDCSIAAF